ncbi:MAG: PKD domain-containing protein [Bacteroidota bacterium]
MYLKRISLLIVLLTLGWCYAAHEDGHNHDHTEHADARKNAPLQATPTLKFIQNANQWESHVRFRTDLPSGRLWLHDNAFTYVFHDQKQLDDIHEKYYHDDNPPTDVFMHDEAIDCHAFRVEFLNANPHPGFSTTGRGKAPHNFFTGTRDKWASGLYDYEKVRYADLYSGIDLEVYSHDKRLKYDFIVAPAADPNRISLQYTGQENLAVINGDLHIKTSIFDLKELKPYAYQIRNGEEVEVPCRYVLDGTILRFEFPDGYDTDKELIIDPTLVGATYSGSTATCYGHSATYDDNGNIYAAGICFGTGFPVSTGAFQTIFGGGTTDIAVNKYSADATTLIYSTYIGGSQADYPHSMVTNAQEELIVLGSTNSSDFPVTNTAYDQMLSGATDITLSHLSTNGQMMIGSTYLGGSNDDGRNLFNALGFNYGDTYRGEVIVDDLGDIYVASVTNSADFPTSANAAQGTYGGGASDGLAAKLNPTLTTLIWSTFIGGSTDDNANSIKLNSNGDPYVTGATASNNFPTTAGVYQATYQGGSADGYLVHLNTTATSFIQSTYIGTADQDGGYFVEIDVADEPYVLGQSTQGNYPVSAGVYSQANGDLFVHKLNANLNVSHWTTTLGEANNSLSPTAFLVDVCGNIYLCAWGQTGTLPVTPDAYQPVGGDDFYLCVLTPNAASLLYATSFGGSGWEHVDGGTSRFDKQGVVYEASCSNSQNWPVTTNAVYPNPTTLSWDVVCFKFEFNYVGVTSAFATFQVPNGCAPYPIDFLNNSSTTPNTTFYWDFGDGTNDTASNPTHIYQNPGTFNVMLIARDTGSCNGEDTAYAQVIIGEPPPINLAQDTFTCQSNPVQLYSQTVAGATYHWTPGGFLSDSTISNPIANPPSTTTFTLTVTDSTGCTNSGNVTINVVEIEVDAGPTVSFCEGEGGTQLQAGAITGGASPYYYTWWCDSTMTNFCGLDSIFDDDPLANPDSSAWYYVQVVDANGCVSNIDSAMVEVLPKPLVDAGPDVGICQPPAPGALLSASVLNGADAPGPYTILWQPAAGLNDPTLFNPYARPDTTTIYTAIVTSANGCTSEYTTLDTTSSVTVTVHPEPIAEAGPDMHVCFGDSIILQGTGTGAGPDYNFEWSPATGLSDSTIANPNASPDLTHEYILTVWSNGCPSIGDPMTLWVHTLPTPSAGPIREICLGESVQLDAFGAGDSSAFYSYQWAPAASLDDPTLENPTATPDQTTMYELVVTSNWGCESPVDTVQVTVLPTPHAEAGPNVDICEGDSIALQGSYYYTTTGPADPSQIYYVWSPFSDMDDNTAPQPVVWPDESGWYQLAVQHVTCETYDSVFVTVIPEVVPVVASDTNITCEGDSVGLYASGGLGGASFTWIPSTGLDDPFSANPQAAPDSTTTYLVVMEEGGCTAENAVTIEIIPRPDVAYLSSQDHGCAPHTVSLLDNSEHTVQYIWDFGDGSPVSNAQHPMHTYEAPGNYTITLTGVNSGGCASEASTTTVNVSDLANADFSVESNTAALTGQTVTTGFPIELFLPASMVQFMDESSTNAVSWTWDFGDGTASSEQHPAHDYTHPGEYMITLTVQNSEGCVSKLTQGPVVIHSPELFIPNVFSPNDDNVNDVFFVEYTGSQPFNLQIYDRWGVMQHQTTNKMAPWRGVNMDGETVPDGVYYYNVRVGDQEYVGNVTLVR